MYCPSLPVGGCVDQCGGNHSINHAGNKPKQNNPQQQPTTTTHNKNNNNHNINSQQPTTSTHNNPQQPTASHTFPQHHHKPQQQQHNLQTWYPGSIKLTGLRESLAGAVHMSEAPYVHTAAPADALYCPGEVPHDTADVALIADTHISDIS